MKLLKISSLVCCTMLLFACKKDSVETTATVKPATEKGAEKEEAAKVEKTGYQIGDEVADFSLKNIDGNMVSLSDYKDYKGVNVIFTCNNCPYAVAYESRINDLHNTYGKHYPVLAINPNDPEVVPEDSFEAMKVRAKEQNFKFKYVIDEGQKIYPLFGATRTPEVYLLENVDGKFILKYTGAIDDNYKDAEAATINYVKEAFVAVDAGKDCEPSMTKAIGCSIKTK